MATREDAMAKQIDAKFLLCRGIRRAKFLPQPTHQFDAEDKRKGPESSCQFCG